MDTAIASLIAVCGTLLGSAITYVFEHRGAQRSERFARAERLRQDRMAAYGAFAGAMTELRRSAITLWFRRQRDPQGSEAVSAALLDADRFGAAADHARFRVQLIADDPAIVARADAAFEPVDAIRHATDRKELVEHERRANEAIAAFITAAGAHVR